MSCAKATYIAAKHGGYKLAAAVPVDLKNKKILGTNEDFYKINPNGNVPTLVLDDGTLLNENVATLYYIGQNSPKKNLLGKSKSEEIAILNAVSFIATEIHKGSYGPMLTGFKTGNQKLLEEGFEKLKEKYQAVLDQYFKGSTGKFLIGDEFSIADAYLYVTTTWAKGLLGLDVQEDIIKYQQWIHENVKGVKEAYAEMAKILEEATK